MCLPQIDLFYMIQKLRELNGEIDQLKVIVGNINISLSAINRLLDWNYQGYRRTEQHHQQNQIDI